jgi:vacuole morphology and inheritance protein 14
MLLPQSSAFATLRNRLNSISPIGYLHLFPRPYLPPTPSLTRSAESTSRADRRIPKPKADEIKWTDLLEKFRFVQLRHEKGRTRQPLLPRSPHIETAPPTPAIGQKRSTSRNEQVAQTPTHKPRGRSIHTLTQGFMNVGRGGDGKKFSQSAKRG